MPEDEHKGPSNPRDFIWWLLAAIAVIIASYFVPGLGEIRNHLIPILVVALLGRLLGYVRQLQRFVNRQVLIAFVIGGLFTLFMSYVFRVIPKSLLYISPVPYPSRQGFYARVVEELEHQAKETGYDLVVWLPARDFSVVDQHSLLQRAYVERSNYTAVIFTPFKAHYAQEDDWLFQFASQIGSERLILFDTDFSDDLRRRLTDKNAGVPPCVMGNEDKAGELAAQQVIRYLEQRHLHNAVIAVMDQQGSSTRNQAFLRTLKGSPNALSPQVDIWRTTEFSGDEARQIATAKLMGGNHVDVIFSGNDISALGVRTAILNLRQQHVAAAQNPIRIMGYDGINEVYQLLQDKSEDILLNSVDVGIPEEVKDIISFANQRGEPLRRNTDSCTFTEPHLIR